MEILMEWGPIVAMMFVGLYVTVARPLVQKMAANPKQDGWDTALATMQKLDPYVDKLKAWADPNSDEVPPTPSNPEGKA